MQSKFKLARFVKLRVSYLYLLILTALFFFILMIVKNPIDWSIAINELYDNKISPTETLDSIRLESYSDGDPIVELPVPESKKNAYLRVKFSFRLSDPQANCLVLKTSDSDASVSFRFRDGAGVIEVPKNESGTELLEFDLALAIGSQTMTINQWYTLEIELQNKAFLRASLDGGALVPPWESGPERIFDFDKFTLGSESFESYEPRYEIRDFTAVKGNIPRFPPWTMFAVFGVLIIMLSLFIGILVLLNERNIEFKKFLCKTLIVGIPLLILIGAFEAALSQINNVYYFKRLAFEKQAEDIEVAVFGSSNTFYAFNPEKFSIRGFNFSHPGSGMYNDLALFERHIESMPSLKMIILTGNFFTIGVSELSPPDPWRKYFYSQFWSIKPYGSDDFLSSDNFWLEPKNFSKLALYGNRDGISQLYKKFTQPVDVIASHVGWFDAGDVRPIEKSRDLGRRGASAHNRTVSPGNIPVNLGYWKRLVNLAELKGIDVAIVVCPTDISYYSELDPGLVRTMNSSLEKFALRNKVDYYNYTADKRFFEEDFTVEMVDHMSGRGANKFSRIVDTEILSTRGN